MATLTIQGLVATTPRKTVDEMGQTFVSFRLAEGVNNVIDSDQDYSLVGEPQSYTNWFTVIASDSNAELIQNSIPKGSRIFVTGKLWLRDWDNGDRSGTTAELICEFIDLDNNAIRPGLMSEVA
jgi:single-strand DNA-binding protein